MKGIRAVLILCNLLVFTAPAMADLYQWRDESGQVHFSDKPSKSQTSEAVEVDVQNNDFDYVSKKARQQYERVRRNEAIQSEAQEKKKKKQEEKKQDLQKRCTEARDMLDTLRGRVVFIRKDGSTYSISEQERQQKEDKLAAQIRRYCK